MVLAGDSAGGGLALATLLAARDAGLPLPAGVVAFSGWFDLTLSGASLAARAAPADVEVALEVYPGNAHVFQHHHATEPTAGRALDSAAAFLVRRLEQDRGPADQTTRSAHV